MGIGLRTLRDSRILEEGRGTDLLRHLNLHDNEIEDVTGLRRLSGLVELNLSANELSALSPHEIEKLVALEKLDISSNRFVTIPNIAPLTSLKELDISYNGIRSLRPLEEAGNDGYLTSLEHLAVHANFICDPNEIKRLTTLKSLRRLRFCSDEEAAFWRYNAHARSETAEERAARKKRPLPPNTIVCRPGYRTAVRAELPWLDMLDGVAIVKRSAMNLGDKVTLRVDGVALRRFYAARIHAADDVVVVEAKRDEDEDERNPWVVSHRPHYGMRRSQSEKDVSSRRGRPFVETQTSKQRQWRGKRKDAVSDSDNNDDDPRAELERLKVERDALAAALVKERGARERDDGNKENTVSKAVGEGRTSSLLSVKVASGIPQKTAVADSKTTTSASADLRAEIKRAAARWENERKLLLQKSHALIGAVSTAKSAASDATIAHLAASRAVREEIRRVDACARHAIFVARSASDAARASALNARSLALNESTRARSLAAIRDVLQRVDDDEMPGHVDIVDIEDGFAAIRDLLAAKVASERALDLRIEGERARHDDALRAARMEAEEAVSDATTRHRDALAASRDRERRILEEGREKFERERQSLESWIAVRVANYAVATTILGDSDKRDDDSSIRATWWRRDVRPLLDARATQFRRETARVEDDARRLRASLDDARAEAVDTERARVDAEYESKRLSDEVRAEREATRRAESLAKRLRDDLTTSERAAELAQTRMLNASERLIRDGRDAANEREKAMAQKQLAIRHDQDRLAGELKDAAESLVLSNGEIKELRVAYEDSAREVSDFRVLLHRSVAKERRGAAVAAKLSKIVSRQKDRIVASLKTQELEVKIAEEEAVALEREIEAKRASEKSLALAESRAGRLNSEMAGLRSTTDACEKESLRLREELDAAKRAAKTGERRAIVVDALRDEVKEHETFRENLARKIESEVSALKEKTLELDYLRRHLKDARDELASARQKSRAAEDARRRAERATSAQMAISEELEGIVSALRSTTNTTTADSRHRTIGSGGKDTTTLVKRLASARKELERKDEALAFAGEEVERMKKLWHAKEQSLRRDAAMERERLVARNAEDTRALTTRLEAKERECVVIREETSEVERSVLALESEVEAQRASVRSAEEKYRMRLEKIRSFAELG
eukprot:g1024.t1